MIDTSVGRYHTPEYAVKLETEKDVTFQQFAISSEQEFKN